MIYGGIKVDEFLATTRALSDIAIAYRAHIAANYLPLLGDSRTKVGYIAVDLEHVREARRLHCEGWHDQSTVDALRYREVGGVAAADCVAVHSAPERRILEQELGAHTVIELPLLVSDADPGEDDLDARAGFLFVGSTHPPNVDAVEYFVGRVLPRIQDQVGIVPFWVVGEVCRRLRGVDLHIPLESGQ